METKILKILNQFPSLVMVENELMDCIESLDELKKLRDYLIEVVGCEKGNPRMLLEIINEKLK